MNEVTTEEYYLLLFVFAIAFAATILRAIRDGDRRSYIRVGGLGGTAGFLAVGVVCVLLSVLGDWMGRTSTLLCIGAAALIGGLGKEQDKIREMVWSALVAGIMRVDQKKNDETK